MNSWHQIVRINKHVSPIDEFRISEVIEIFTRGILHMDVRDFVVETFVKQDILPIANQCR